MRVYEFQQWIIREHHKNFHYGLTKKELELMKKRIIYRNTLRNGKPLHIIGTVTEEKLTKRIKRLLNAT